MSEDKTDTHPAPPVHFEHYCEHPGCTKWGGNGFDHRPEIYRGERQRYARQ